MPVLTEQWIEIDDEHVKHVQTATYTKTELAIILGAHANPVPKYRAIDHNQTLDIETDNDKQLEDKS